MAWHKSKASSTILPAGNAPHPVVPAFVAVVRHVELGPKAALQQPVQERRVDQLSVGVNLGNLHLVPDQRVHNVPEIAADQRLSAGEGHPHHAAVRHLLDDIHDGAVGQFAQLGVGGGHVAVLAAIVAPARDGPVDGADVAVAVQAVFLLRVQGRRRIQLL